MFCVLKLQWRDRQHMAHNRRSVRTRGYANGNPLTLRDGRRLIFVAATGQILRLFREFCGYAG